MYIELIKIIVYLYYTDILSAKGRVSLKCLPHFYSLIESTQALCLNSFVVGLDFLRNLNTKWGNSDSA